MKKLLTLLVVAAMVLSLAGTAFAADVYGDIANESATAKTAITKLSALDIINGYEDGTFKPGNEITRAEFAKIACIAAGMKDSGEILKNTASQFSDVKTGVWYTGWVNLAAAQGYVKGYPDGTFQPNAKINNAAVVTVLLRVLGYNDNLAGPWPVDYIAKAGTLGVTDDVAFDASANAVRGGVAVMAANTLDEDPVYWDTDKEKFEDDDATVATLMAENFDGAVYEDYLVTDFELVDDTWKVTLAAWNGTNYAAVAAAPLNGKVEVAETAKFNGAAIVPALENKIIDLVWDADEEEIAYMDVKDYGVVVFDEVDFDAATNEVTIDDVDYDFANIAVKPATLVAGTNTADKFEVVLNDDGDIAAVVTTDYLAPKIVDEYDAAREKITYQDGSSALSIEDQDVLIVKGNEIIEAADLAKFDLVDVTASAHGQDYYILVSDAKAAGELTKSGSFEVTVGGKTYDVSDDDLAAPALAAKISTDDGDTFSSLTNYNSVYDEAVTLLVDLAGDVYAVIAGDTAADSDIYGTVVETITASTSEGTKKYLRIVTVDGVEASYEYEGTLTGTTIVVTPAIDDLVVFDLDSDSVIDTFDVLFDDSAAAPALNVTGVDTDNNRIKLSTGAWLIVNNDSVMFDVNDSVAGGDDDEAVIADWADVKDYLDAGSNITGVFAQEDGGKLEYLVFNVAGGLTTDDKYVVVSEIGVNTDGDYVTVVYADGAEATYTAPATAAYDKDNDAADDDALTDFAVEDLVKIKTSGDDVDSLELIVNESAVATTFVQYEIDEINGNSVRIYDTVAKTYNWYVVDEDTVYFNLDDEAALTLSDLGVGDAVEMSVDAAGEFDYIIIND